MHLLGTPIQVLIDDYLPYDNWYDETLLYAYKSDDGALWNPLIEKAAAKFMGNYEAINGGMEYTAFDMLIAGGYAEYWSEETSVDEFWEAISTADANNDMITVGTYVGDTWGDQYSNELGLPYMHAFAIIGSDTVNLPNGSQQRLVKLRNPWAMEEYSGPYSDSSDDWTQALLNQTGH